jgi:hypothetical protein
MTERAWQACADPFRLLGPAGLGLSSKGLFFCCACWQEAEHLLTAPARRSLRRLRRLAGNIPDPDREPGAFDEFLLAVSEIEWALAHAFWSKAPWRSWGTDDWMDYLGVALAAGTDSALTRWDRASVHAGAALTVVGAAMWGDEILMLKDDLDDPPSARGLAQRIARCAAEAGGEAAQEWPARQRRHADLLRDVTGNPSWPVAINPAWAAWNRGAVGTLAGSIRDEGRFGDLPILADALEEAGCVDGNLLGHLRGAGPHVPGCWALDLLLPTQGAAAEQPAPGRLRRKGK